MNDQTNSFGPDTAEDRWIDALLTEHARLGRDGEDEELVYRILANTVQSPTQPSSVRARAAAPQRRWAGVGLGAAIAALVSLLLVALMTLPVGKKNAPNSEELRFVVRILESEKSVAALPAKTIAGQPTTVPTVASVPVSRGIPALARIELYNPVHSAGDFAPSFRSEDFRIRADHQQQRDADLVYEGKVLVEHKDFRIEADRVKLRAPGTPADSSQLPLLAENVRVVQAGTDCVAEADQLQYDPANASLLLTGITRMSTARGELARFDPTERVVLSRTGFFVQSGPVEIHASIPLKQR